MGWVKGSDRNFEASQTERYERQRKTEENVERRPVVTPRYESGGEAQARERPARDLGLALPKTCAARVVA
jgi:hypothetical protein